MRRPLAGGPLGPAAGKGSPDAIKAVDDGELSEHGVKVEISDSIGVAAIDGGQLLEGLSIFRRDSISRAHSFAIGGKGNGGRLDGVNKPRLRPSPTPFHPYDSRLL